MLKRLINAIKLHRLNNMLTDLCGSSVCKNCKSYLGNKNCTSRPLCAQYYIFEQALDVWGSKNRGVVIYENDNP